jgi:predicted alpha/beta superfamily hydrolase
MSTETIVPSIEGVQIATEAPASDLRRHSVRSELLGGERELVVFVPPGYDDEQQRRYPVLYMHDGQNLFDPETAYVPGKHWRLGETANERIENGDVQPMIIVGVYHAGEKRINEYTPTRDAKNKAGGKAEIYLDALVNEFKAFIDEHYRTLTGPQNTGVGGSSLGGLIALYAGLQRPDVFGKVAAMSPSVWWDRRYVVRMMKQMLLKPRLSVWLDIGTEEGAKTLADVRAMKKALETRGWVEGQDLRYVEVKGAAHDEGAWADRVGDVLTALFPAAGELVAQ